MKIFFDLPHLYYLPQYSPVIFELQNRGHTCQVVIYDGTNLEAKKVAVQSLGLPFHIATDRKAAADIYAKNQPEWVFFGNSFGELDVLHPDTRTALLFHGSGTGVKSASLISGLGSFDVRFVSGPGRMKIFSERFPNTKMVEVGFAKLDPIFDPDRFSVPAKIDLHAVGLDPAKPTILYAPTFYPSSIENMAKKFPSDFEQFNILIKCHDFTLNKKKYSHQLKKVCRWAKADNVYFATPDEYSLVPFMNSADVMITDSSSAIFEFAALNKPVIICGFIHIRWTYRGPFRYKLNKRIDASTTHYLSVAEKVNSYRQLLPTTKKHLNNPRLLEHERIAYADEIMGNRDGRASIRVADYILK